jgi:hypothetical protein
MRTIFALLESLDEAKAVVAELIDRHFDEGEMNVIARVPTSQEGPEANVRAVNRTGPPEKEILQEIDRVLREGKSVIMADVGAVRAAGRIAAVITGGAATPEKHPQGLEDVLVGLGVPEELAEFYRNGVLEGGLLFWVRTGESRAAEARDVLSSARVEKLANYA